MTKTMLAAVRLQLLNKQDRGGRYLVGYAKDKMIRRFGFLTRMEAPAVVKVSLNVGVGSHRSNKEAVADAKRSLAMVTAQAPTTTKASKAIASFKVRKHEDIGLRATMRGRRMHEFLDHLVNLAVPRARDFRGITPKSLDSRGNITIGLSDCSIFPELVNGKADGGIGMNVSVVVSAGSKTLTTYLLRAFDFPLKR